MTSADVITALQRIFDDVLLTPVTLTHDLSANDVEEWDSLVHISLVVAVEKEFNIKFRVGEVETTGNIGQFAELISRRLKGH